MGIVGILTVLVSIPTLLISICAHYRYYSLILMGLKCITGGTLVFNLPVIYVFILVFFSQRDHGILLIVVCQQDEKINV